MIGSSLKQREILARHYTPSRQGSRITEITIHHMSGVASAEQCVRWWISSNRIVSSHYGIGNGGEIIQYVDERHTAFTNSNWEANKRAVTIETSNSTMGPAWKVSDAAFRSLVLLVADIAKRNGLHPLVKGKSLTWHSMYSNTDCPGPYLKARIPLIIAEANRINTEAKVVDKWIAIDDKSDGWVNVRMDAGVIHSVKRRANNGEIYHVTKEKDNWGFIGDGWVQLQLTKKAQKPEEKKEEEKEPKQPEIAPKEPQNEAKDSKTDNNPKEEEKPKNEAKKPVFEFTAPASGDYVINLREGEKLQIFEK